MTETVERPNGKTYRARKVVAMPVGLDGLEGVIVLGTHDIDRAKTLADVVVRQEVGPGYEAVRPGRVWWSDRMRYGERVWEDDAERGRAGVYFADVAESVGGAS